MSPLYRSTHDRKLAGICGGLGKYFKMNSTDVRIATVFLMVPLSIVILLGYIIGIFVIPKDTSD
ncbi:hypothetical protein CR194_19155 [Salipaludibacillus keqinensis]|uniref:Phage shock protein PspC N-terminal domain-containing protein n=1 Tax=Salipaludibacillus keqinensis TaxID=2045207 RepID=A0A323T6N2_9BACI|nr:PspC domain-containing protein [Salipaludibacillus keqinensis]PYZ91741.1 hypothetical protein CR194_19155 [Salipaludibacillus keqinensis]